jgi:hypothetical protein
MWKLDQLDHRPEVALDLTVLKMKSYAKSLLVLASIQ